MSVNRIKQLEDLIIHHRACYYQGRPQISDYEFDKLEDELRNIDPHNHVLNLVGSQVTDEAKVKHDQKMLSLEKTYIVDDLVKWQDNHELLSTYKIDGVSCSLIYQDGKLSLAKTRGDGVYGEKITAKVLWMDTIPKRVENKQDKIEIRGELYCREKNFMELAEEMEKMNLERPTSPRNIVAGLISRKDNLELSRYLTFQAFDLILPKETFKLEYEKYRLLEQMGFDLPQVKLHPDSSSIPLAISEAQQFMEDGDYQIDGLVFTYNEISLHNELGFTNHHPKFKMAFKFKGESKVTRLENIEWSVSRNGILTPVGIVTPVELSGATINRVTLHNFGAVKIYNLKKGDEIEIIRSGEVIPKFLAVINSSQEKFDYPKTCPECHSETRIEDIRLLCSNVNCQARIKEQILNFIKKIGIEDLSVKRLEQLITKGLVKNIPDLYKMSAEDLLKMDKTKEKLSDKLFESIQQSKTADITTFLSALGIVHGAYNTCEKVVHAGYNTIEKLLALTPEELSKVDKFAEKSANDFVRSLQEKKELIEELTKLGFVFREESGENKILSGKKICITGALSEKRSIVEQKIRDLGGVVTSSVSKDTHMLLTNEKDSSSSKFIKAKKLGVEIIDEATFFSLFHN